MVSISDCPAGAQLALFPRLGFINNPARFIADQIGGVTGMIFALNIKAQHPFGLGKKKTI
jgi:hypothetical protein